MIDKQQGYLPTTGMRELIQDNAMLLPAIGRFNIALGFGDTNIDKVCQENGVHTDTFLCVCNLLSGYKYRPALISLPTLMAYLTRAHESFLEIEFPKIRHRLIDAIHHTATDEVSFLLIQFFDEYVLEVRKHMEHENNVVFDYVKQLLDGQPDSRFLFSQYASDHSDTVTKLNELKDVFIYHYKQSGNARLCSALFDIIICERDMLSHFDVETKLFIPAVENLEKEVMRKNKGGDKETCHSAEPDSTLLNLLTDRERDIIKYLALGKVNKEIADILCISIHTVATHRRNIASKLDIHTTAGLTVFAILHHIVDINDVTPV